VATVLSEAGSLLQQRIRLRVGDYRPVSSITLENAIKLVEGLVVDTKTGGIGFRNHMIPVGLNHGATWMEDLLFIEPQSSCVKLILSIDFTVNVNQSRTAPSLSELYLVGQGGILCFKYNPSVL
jgi:hypothetical protein